MSIPESLKEMFPLVKDKETGKKERTFDVKDGSEKALAMLLSELFFGLLRK